MSGYKDVRIASQMVEDLRNYMRLHEDGDWQPSEPESSKKKRKTTERTDSARASSSSSLVPLPRRTQLTDEQHLVAIERWANEHGGELPVKCNRTVDFRIGCSISTSIFHVSGWSVPFEIHLFSIFPDFRSFAFKGVREHPKANCVRKVAVAADPYIAVLQLQEHVPCPSSPRASGTAHPARS